jgi:hypothetical protein
MVAERGLELVRLNLRVGAWNAATECKLRVGWLTFGFPCLFHVEQRWATHSSFEKAKDVPLMIGR